MLEICIIKGYDLAAHRAEVQLASSLTTYFDAVPVPTHLREGDLVPGRRGILALPGDNAPDALLLAVLGRPTPLTFYEAWVAHQPAAAGAWEDWDMTALIPPATVAVEIVCANLGSSQTVGVREEGSARIRVRALPTNAPMTLTTPVYANRKVQVFAQLREYDAVFNLSGYWR